MNEIEIYKYLSSKGLYYEVCTMHIMGTEFVCVDIEWGDWKHDHGYCDYLMEELGFECVNVKVTEEDGSDCYSATHTYCKH